MTKYEYKVIPAPMRGEKARGVKGPEARFAHALERVMNELGGEGWDYIRADILPCEERAGFTGKKLITHNMLVFRRALPHAEAGEAPADSTAPAPVARRRPPVIRAFTGDRGKKAQAPEASRTVAPLHAPMRDDASAPTPPDITAE